MARFARIGGSFLVVLVAYWSYALTIVPLVEPPANRYEAENLSREELKRRAQGTQQRWQRELDGLFPPGAWELDDPMILESDQFKLLLKGYKNLGGGQVEICPCTMIFTPNEPANDLVMRKRRSIVLKASEGALLKFDQALDLRQAKIGRLEGGQLKGRITIRSEGESLGPEDNLTVVTRDVDINEERIWSPHAVDFRLGSNSGQGRKMRIKFLSAKKDQTKNTPGPNVEGIELFEVRELRQLHLEPGEGGVFPDADPTSIDIAAGSKPLDDSNLPVEISCRGPFRFDPIAQLATFEDRVNVLRIHPEGPSDQLNCDTLYVYFARPRSALPGLAGRKQEGTQRKRTGSLDLEPRLIKAKGSPVFLRSPSQQIEARGEELEFDVQSGRITLDGTRQVWLQRGLEEIHARHLKYTAAESGGLGQISAKGPGFLRAQVGKSAAEQLYASWGENLEVQPWEGQQAISLVGGAELNYAGIGRLTAGQIHLFLDEMPPKTPGNSDRPEFRPDRMVAQGRVWLNSPQLSGEVDKWEVWFIHPRQEQAPQGPVVSGDTVVSNEIDADGVAATGSGGLFGAKSLSPQDRSDWTFARRHFKVTGSLLQSRVTMRDQKQELSDIIITGGVSLTETRTAEPDEIPLIVTGDRIDVIAANSPSTTVTITGSPTRWAQFQGRGLTLMGPSIELDRGKNLLYIDGSGRMKLPMDRDLFQDRRLANPDELQIDWKRHMEFDGLTAHFEDDIVAAGRYQHLEAETLDVILAEKVWFDELDSQTKPRPQRIVCNGGRQGVFVENHSFDEQQTRLSIERMWVVEFDVNLTTGEAVAEGPGRMTSVGIRSFDLPGGRSGGNPIAARVAPTALEDPAKPADKQLTHLNVRFEGSLEGNVKRKKMTFHDQVRAAYGPVKSWQDTLDPDEPDLLGPDDALLKCRELTVVHMPIPNREERAVELEALGNVSVEGSGYFALAPRMTYTEAKQLLLMESKDWTDAELYHQKQAGAPHSGTSAKRILYWCDTGKAEFEGPRSLKLSQFPRR